MEKGKDEKVISHTKNIYQENEDLKYYQQAFTQLNEQNFAMKEGIQELETNIGKSINDDFFTQEQVTKNENCVISFTGRSSPDGQQINDEYCTDLKHENTLYWEEKINILETEKLSLETDRNDLLKNHK